MTPNPDSVAVLREIRAQRRQMAENYAAQNRDADVAKARQQEAALDAAIAALSAQGAEPVAWIDSHKLARLRDGWSGVVYGKAASEYAGQLSVPPELVPLYLHLATPGSDAVTEALHNAIALFGGRCTDATQLVWLESAKAALAARTGKANG